MQSILPLRTEPVEGEPSPTRRVMATDARLSWRQPHSLRGSADNLQTIQSSHYGANANSRRCLFDIQPASIINAFAHSFNESVSRSMFSPPPLRRHSSRFVRYWQLELSFSLSHSRSPSLLPLPTSICNDPCAQTPTAVES